MEEDGSYKYLGILEADQIMHKEMKDCVRKEYYRSTRKIFKSKLNGGNSIKSVNTWAVSLLRYSAAFIGWTRNELKEMDRQTCKIVNMNGALHPGESVTRLYMPRKEGGRGLVAVEVCVDMAVLSLEKYMNDSTAIDKCCKKK